MYKKIIALLVVLICSLLFSSYGAIYTVSDNSRQDDIYNVDENKLIAEIPNSNVKLYYVKEDKDSGMYSGFILQIDEAKKYYRWENVTNPTYGPKLELSDLDEDGTDEIIVHLCKGTGTGILDEEVHVIRQKPLFGEILIENPVIILYKNAKASEFPEHFEIILKNKKVIVNKEGILTPPYSEVGLGWGEGNISYEVKDNRLYARVRVGAQMINIGEMIVKYKYQDDILQMESIDFHKYRK